MSASVLHHINEDNVDKIVPYRTNLREQNRDYKVFKGKAPLHKAIEESNKYGRLPIFSLDIAMKNTNTGAKSFVTTSYQSFWKNYVSTCPKERCFYEIILHEQPCHLYVDLDMDRNMNPNINVKMEVWMQNEFIKECKECLINFNLANKSEDIRIITLDSTKESKFSKHFIFKINGICFTNNYHCGAFIRRVRNKLLLRYGNDLDKNPFFIWKTEKDRKNKGKFINVHDFYADLAVYTKRRNWRLYASTKRAGEYRPLLLENQVKTVVEMSIDKETFMDCLVQRISDDTSIFDCLEEDGSKPYSTNDKNFQRTDISNRLHPPIKIFSRNYKIRKIESHPDKQIPDYNTRYYYENIYPFKVIFSLFGQKGREFVFEDATGRIKRYLFFETLHEFRNSTLIKLPSAIHIGPIYHQQKDSNGNRTVKSRELIFDIDLNDYGELRACCKSEKRACKKCWKYAQFSIRILDRFLRGYGFNKIFFFYSGMKGFHCWVFDESACNLSRMARETLLNDLKIEEITLNPPKTIQQKRSYVSDVLSEKSIEYYINILTKEQKELKDQFLQKQNEWGLESAILYFIWPRIDSKVTIELNHMLKSPFARNPKTGSPCWMLNNITPENPITDVPNLIENIAIFHSKLQ